MRSAVRRIVYNFLPVDLEGGVEVSLAVTRLKIPLQILRVKNNRRRYISR
jgi:hypothetical protein